MADPPREINTARASSSMLKVNGTTPWQGKGGVLDVKNNVGEAETYLASPGGADDPPQFVCAFQRLRIGFV
jgi:hypothetical protein